MRYQPRKNLRRRLGSEDSTSTLEADAIAKPAEDLARATLPVHRVNVDFPSPMLEELDNAAIELNISRH